jgi:hypothetical protein
MQAHLKGCKVSNKLLRMLKIGANPQIAIPSLVLTALELLKILFTQQLKAVQ